MSITHADIDSFCSFAKSQIAVHRPESMSELFDLFLLEHPTPEEQQEVRAAIEEGIADMKAGRVRPADEVMAEIHQRYGLKQE